MIDKSQIVSNRMHGIEVVALCLLTSFSLMAFSAVAAQAAVQKDGDWLIGSPSKAITTTQTVKGAIDVLIKDLVAKKDLSLDCPKATVKSMTLSPLSGTESKGSAEFLFEECTALSIETGAELPCHVLLAGGAGESKLHVTVNASLVVVLDHGVSPAEAYILASGAPLARILFTDIAPKFCPLPEEVELKGSVLFELLSGTNSVQLIKEAPAVKQAKYGDSLLFGVNPATLDGSMGLEITAPIAGVPWGID